MKIKINIFNIRSVANDIDTVKRSNIREVNGKIAHYILMESLILK